MERRHLGERVYHWEIDKEAPPPRDRVGEEAAKEGAGNVGYSPDTT